MFLSLTVATLLTQECEMGFFELLPSVTFLMTKRVSSNSQESSCILFCSSTGNYYSTTWQYCFVFFLNLKIKNESRMLLFWIPIIGIKLVCTKMGMVGLNNPVVVWVFFFWGGGIFSPKIKIIFLPVWTRGCGHDG